AGNSDVIVPHDQPGLTEFVNRHELAWIFPPFVDDACVDIKLFISEERPLHPSQTNRPENVDLNPQTANPGIHYQRPNHEIVMGMVVRNEDVAQPIQGHSES